MANIEPTTDRELLLQVNSDVTAMRTSFSEAVDRLRESVERLTTSFTRMEEQKITVMQKEIDDIKAWMQELKGGWKLAVIIWVVSLAVIGMAIKYYGR